MQQALGDDTKMISSILLIQFGLMFVFIVAFQVAMGRLSLHREAKRRWQHVMTGQIIVFQFSYMSFPIHWSIAGLVLGASLLWYWQKYDWNMYMKVLGPFLRPDELSRNKFPGSFYFLLGIAITLSFFHLEVARYAVECMSVADPVAAWIGQAIPSRKLMANRSTASISGSAGCFLAAWIIGWVMLPSLPDRYATRLLRITAGAIACTISEAFPLLQNDNFAIPLFTALIVTLVQ
jgi:dolichol kinase